MSTRWTPPKTRPWPPSPPGVTIAYGARCVWWDDKRHVGSRDGTPTGLPCCPHCRGVLFETDDKAWFDGLDRFHASHPEHPDYRAACLWGRGRCFPTVEARFEAYVAAGRPK